MMQVSVSSIKCSCELGKHLHPGADYEDIVCQYVAANADILSHGNDPRSHDEGNVGH